MVINKEVAAEVAESVSAINRAYHHLERGEKSAALDQSRAAFRKSENAFFDVSLLELLYFPQDQKFAIYVPLFLPVGIPILIGARDALKFFWPNKKKLEWFPLMS